MMNRKNLAFTSAYVHSSHKEKRVEKKNYQLPAAGLSRRVTNQVPERAQNTNSASTLRLKEQEIMPIGSQYSNFQSHKQRSPYLRIQGVTQVLDAVGGTMAESPMK